MSAAADAVEVVLDWTELGGAQTVGTLHMQPTRGSATLSFEYDRTWLRNGHGRALDPDLELFSGRIYPRQDRADFGVFLDSAPDRWGRMLMQRRENWQARREDRKPRTLRDWDFLLGIHDATRLGALRFRRPPGGSFLAADDGLAVPPLTRLRELAAAARHVEADDDDEGKWLQQLVAPGSSLGGARPKAVVEDERGHLCIAKFPSAQDRADVGAWEYVVHHLALAAGIEVPQAQTLDLGGHGSTLLLRRFDRTDTGARVPYASAMTLLGRRDGEPGASYLDLAELLMRDGARAKADLVQLFRRAVFNVAVSNTDDHLRNHGFLLTPTGWILAPAFDMNPNPDGGAHAMLLDEVNDEGDVNTVMATHRAYQLTAAEANEVLAAVLGSVQTWRAVASHAGIGKRQIDEYQAAFCV